MKLKIRLQDKRALSLTLIMLVTTLLFNIVIEGPQAQTRVKLPPPTSRVSDLAGVLDEEAKQRLENILENLVRRRKIDFYLALVENTGGRDVFDFSRQLALDWDIGARTTRKKSLLLVLSTNDKTAFTQFSRSVQSDLPDGVLGEMSQRMRGPISAGRFKDAVNSGVNHFIEALARKSGLTLRDFEEPVLVANASKVEEAAPTPEPQPTTQPTPETESTPVGTPVSDTSSAAVEADADTKALTRDRRVTGNSPIARPSVRKSTTPEEDEAELTEVNLTLTLPFEPRVAKLKQFLENYPRSKSRPLAEELLISAYAALGDEKLKSGDLSGGAELLFRAIDEAPGNPSDKLFSGVLSQIPLNLYLRGNKEAAYKAARNIEAKFGDNAKHLIDLSGFYLRLEDGEEATRIAAQAIKLAPEMAEAHHNHGLALHISFRINEAMAAYKRALELDSRSKGARRILADLSRATGQAEQALALYREQLELEPGDRAARAGLVVALLEAGRREEAATELEAALKEDPKNYGLLTGAAYWLLARGDIEKGSELAQKAVEAEPRYTWAQIAAARAFLAQKQPLEAERALRFARQYGKFPTLDYELANALASMGLFQEAAETLKQTFAVKDGRVEARLGGRRLTRASGFLELLADERQAGIFQALAADTASNAAILKSLLEFYDVLNRETPDEEAIVAAAKAFASGDDATLAFRQIFAASRLLMKNLGFATAFELAQSARNGVERALGVGAVEVAVQADEFRDMRARVLASGGTPYVAEAPRDVLLNILLGKIEDLSGWALFNQDKTSEAIDHLRRAANVLPEATPAWRAALWHLGAALEQADKKNEALTAYIRSYVAGEPDPVRRQLIEQLYQKQHGSLDGLEQMISEIQAGKNVAISPESTTLSSSAAATESTASARAAQPPPGRIEILPEVTPNISREPESSPPAERPTDSPPADPEKPSAESTPKPEPKSPPPSSPTEAETIAAAAARIRANIKINGRVRDASNNGIPNVVVILVSPRGTVLAATTDAQGRYSFNVAPSQRNYRLVPSKEGFQFDPVDRTIVAFAEDLKDVDFVGSTP